MKRQTIIIFLLVIILLGIFLRIYNLEAESLWLDECFTLVYSSEDFTGLLDRLKIDWHPILYYLIMQANQYFLGNSEFALRLPSAIFGILALFLTYLAGKELFDQKTGLLASLFLAVSYTAILYSQDAKMYSLFIAVFLSSFLYFLKLLKKPSLNHFLIFGTANALLINLHVIGFLINFLYLIYYFTCNYLWKSSKIDLTLIIFKRFKARYDLNKYFYSLLITFALYLPWLKIFLTYQFSGLFLRGLRTKIIEKMGLNLYPIILVIVLMGFIFYLFIVYYLTKRKRSLHKLTNWSNNLRFNEKIFSILLIFYLIIDLFISKHLFTSVHLIRFSIFLLPIFYLFLARGFFKIKNKKLFIFLLSLFLIISSIELYRYYIIDSKEQFRTAAEFITKDAGVNDVLFFHRSGITKQCFDYYYQGNLKGIRLVDKNDTYKLKINSQEKDYAYLILSHNFHTHNYFKEELEKLYPLVKHKKLIGIDIYKFIVS